MHLHRRGAADTERERRLIRRALVEDVEKFEALRQSTGAVATRRRLLWRGLAATLRRRLAAILRRGLVAGVETAAAPSLGVRLQLFAHAGDELRDTLRPPWPRWMHDLYHLEQSTDAGIDSAAGEVTLSGALSALGTDIHQRLQIVAFACGALERLGWQVRLDGDTLVASADLNREQLLHALEQAGVAGPLCKVTDLDELGNPVLVTS